MALERHLASNPHGVPYILLLFEMLLGLPTTLPTGRRWRRHVIFVGRFSFLMWRCCMRKVRKCRVTSFVAKCVQDPIIMCLHFVENGSLKDLNLREDGMHYAQPAARGVSLFVRSVYNHILQVFICRCMIPLFKTVCWATTIKPYSIGWLDHTNLGRKEGAFGCCICFTLMQYTVWHTYQNPTEIVTSKSN